jgi:serine protease Do
MKTWALFLAVSLLNIGSVQGQEDTDFGPAFRAAAKTVEPYIVRLGPFKVTVKRPAMARLPMVMPGGGKPKKKPVTPESWSTAGLIVSDGYVLTSLRGLNSVKKDIPLESTAGLVSSAQMVGADSWRDLALLRCPDLKGPKTLRLAKTNSLDVGSFTIAVGAAPHGGGLSIHVGILSATSRFSQRLLQSDARTHNGVWGGVLLNLDGEILGLVTVASDRPKELAGVTFAVRAEDLLANIAALKKGKALLKPEDSFLGIYIEKDKFPLTLTRTVPGSAAEKAGLKIGDEILDIGGLELRDAKSLQGVLGRFIAGDKLSILIVRDKKRIRIRDVVLGAKPKKLKK